MAHLLLLIWTLLLAPTALAAKPPMPSCVNPRAAADTLFVWQTADNHNPTHAATCLDSPDGASPEALAVQLKTVLDARGLWVPVHAMSTDPEYVDAQGDPHLLPMPAEAPWLSLERGDDGLWRYSRRTLEEVPRLYRDTFSPISQWFQAQLPSVFYNRIAGFYLWQAAYAILLVLVAWSTGRVVDWLLIGQVRRWVERAGLRLPEAAHHQLRLPLVVLSMAIILWWGVPDLQLRVNVSWTLLALLKVLVAFAVVLATSRVVNIAAGVFEARAELTDSKLDDQLVPLARQAAQVVVWSLGVLFILQNQGIDVAGLIAGLGIGGLAFALAAKDTIANLFGSLNIFLDKPFQVGDSIEVGGVSGVVEEVGFRSTRVRTFHNSLVTVPNSNITNANVDNMGQRPKRRVRVTLGLTYDTTPERLQAFVEGIRAILAAHPKVEQSYEAHFNEFGASSLDILVNFHVTTRSWTEELETRSQVFLAILRLAEELDVSFAFPSTSVYLESTPEQPLGERPPRTLDDLEAVFAAYGPRGAKAANGSVPFQRSYSAHTLRDEGQGE